MEFFCLCDLDGTLLNSTGEVDLESIHLINNMTDKVKIIIVSQASYLKLIELKEKYNIEVDIFSTSSKKALLNNQLYFNTIDSNIISKIIRKFENSIYTAYGEGMDNNYIYKYQERLTSIYPKKYQEEFIDLTVLYLSIYNDCYDEFMLYLGALNLDAELIMQDYKKSLLCISKKKFTKEEAFDLAKNIYNLEAIGITDSIKDINMIKKCKIKIAMKNGDLELKNKCEIITEFDNNSAGAMKTLFSLL